ncbi:MAG: SGNH/GDSL hydrolase family protein [Abditibacteriaceae bacterium]
MPPEQKMKNVQQLDPNMKLKEIDGKGLQWISPMQSPFVITGFPWIEEERIYRRLPQNPHWPIRPDVDTLANCATGGQIRFATNSRRLSIRVVLSAAASMDHMTATGQSGFDCYIGAPGLQCYLSTTRFDHTKSEYEAVLFDTENTDLKNITLNFPLYQGVEEVSLGVDLDAELAAPPEYEDAGKVIFYGTSITQGGCAARPGMAFTNILSRRINREFINLGFSGNGRGEPELAHIIGEIPDAACYVLDYDANVPNAEAMQNTLPEFIRILREDHPVTPILVISRVPTADEFYNVAGVENRLSKAKVQRETVARLQSQGDQNISFLDGAEMMSDAYREGTVDGGHPTDLGFWLTANALEPILKKLLA